MTRPTVAAAVQRELAELGERDEALAESGLGLMAVALARRLDDPKTSASAAAACARELREVLGRLRELAPPAVAGDGVTELGERARLKLLAEVREPLPKKRAKRRSA